jgi:plasmid stabilization system protein ParE
MPGFTLTKKAKADLKEIARYTQDQWGRDQRDKYLAMLDGCFHQLAANPFKCYPILLVVPMDASRNECKRLVSSP